MIPARREKILGLVSGLPEPKRSNCILMTLQAFIDDSKTGSLKEPGAVFVLAGYISSVEEWLRFSDEWQSVLDGPPTLGPFKMSQFVRQHGLSDPRLGLLRRVIERNVRGAVSMTVEMDVYRSFLTSIPGVEKLHENPYYMMLIDMVIQLKRAAPLVKLDGEIEFIFDEQIGDKDHIKYAWEGIKHTRPDIAEFIGNEPKWEKEEKFLPLQAADKMAWWTRKHREESLAGKPLTEIPWKQARIIPQIIMELDKVNLTHIFKNALP